MKARYHIFLSKTCSFIYSRRDSHLLKTDPHPDLQTLLLKRAAASESDWLDGGPSGRLCRPCPCCLTCMMSMAIVGVWTPSTLFTIQCTTSALMKQHGERPFCSESSWTPVLVSNAVGREQGVSVQGGNKQKEVTKKGLPLKHLISEVRVPIVHVPYTISRPREISMMEQKNGVIRGKEGKEKGPDI